MTFQVGNHELAITSIYGIVLGAEGDVRRDLFNGNRVQAVAVILHLGIFAIALDFQVRRPS